MAREKHSKTFILNLKDETHCRIASTDEINSAMTSVDESDTKTPIELFPLFQLPHLSHPLEAEFITTEEHKIVSIYGISLNSEGPCFIENFGYQEVVSSFPQDKRSLLLTNAANIDILRFLCMTMLKISVKFDQIIFIDCIDINNVELRNEIICKNPKNSVIVLYDILEHNVNLFKEIRFHLIGHDSLIIASLMNGEALPFLDEDSQKSLVVVNSSSDLDVHREKRGMEGLAEPFKEQQLSDYEFFLNGEFWKITYEGKTTTLKNTKGLRYIHYLLENPNIDFTPTELLDKVSKVTPDAYRMLGKHQERKPTEDDSAKKSHDGIPFGQVLTDEARNELMKRYNKLKSDLDDNTEIKCDEEVVGIEKEMKQIMECLAASINKDGKSRNFADITERNRRSVSKAIDAGLDKINDEKNGLPALWKHFDLKLQSGTSCFYKPEKPIPWNL
jgi:hypothetical protein